VTRIIAGEYGGRRIAVPARGTRPTTDRVREAIFSRLESEDGIRGAAVLDAFAGSGALGIEALSRGAASATFVESAAWAAAVVRDNLADLGLSDSGTLVRQKVLPWLKRTPASYALAFLDPPYDLPAAELDATLAALAPRLEPGARVVLEWSSRGEEPRWPDALRVVATKRYGETIVHFAVARGGDGSAADSLDA
jgi:16S rRNA (guanine966-N2)-methyltransferase